MLGLWITPHNYQKHNFQQGRWSPFFFPFPLILFGGHKRPINGSQLTFVGPQNWNQVKYLPPLVPSKTASFIATEIYVLVFFWVNTIKVTL